MSDNRLVSILYVGGADAAEKLQNQATGRWVYTASSLFEALGMYINYAPTVIIIDTCIAYATEAYQHLRSVDAAPIILLVDEPINARRRHDELHLPRTSTIEMLFEKAQMLLNFRASDKAGTL